MKPASPGSELRDALASLRQFFKRAVMFSVFTNVLVLAPTFYMLEVYGRVVNSRSFETLLMLTVLVIGIYVVMEFVDWVRSKLVHAAGTAARPQLGDRVFNATFEARLRNLPVGITPLNDLRNLRAFLASPACIGDHGRADRAAVHRHHLRDERAAGYPGPGRGNRDAGGRLCHRAQDQPAARRGTKARDGSAALRVDDAQERAGDRGDGHDGAHPQSLARPAAQVPRPAGRGIRSRRAAAPRSPSSSRSRKARWCWASPAG